VIINRLFDCCDLLDLYNESKKQKLLQCQVLSNINEPGLEEAIDMDHQKIKVVKPLMQNSVKRKPVLLRITTVPMSLRLLITGQPQFMHDHGWEVHLASAPGADWDQIPLPEKWHRHEVAMERDIAIAKDVRSFWNMVGLIKKIKPDIVHTHTPKAGLIGMAAAWYCGVPIRIHTLAGMPMATATGLKKRILKLTEKLTYAFSHETWINSAALKEFVLQEKMIASKKAQMILHGSSNGVDISQFKKEFADKLLIKSLQEQYEIKDNQFIFLAVGRVVKDKGIIELLEAFTSLQKKHSQARLFILGPFEQHLDPLPEATIKALQHHTAITHINWSDDIPAWMSMADCFIHASHREGFPNVVLQAGAMGCPVIVSIIPGNIDIVTGEEYGWRFAKGDANALFQQMEYVISNKQQALEKSRKLQERINLFFDRKAVHAAILERYQYLMASKLAKPIIE
jgi:glycosyltransferase involved in cell wall biosynthesis